MSSTVTVHSVETFSNQPWFMAELPVGRPPPLSLFGSLAKDKISDFCSPQFYKLSVIRRDWNYSRALRIMKGKRNKTWEENTHTHTHTRTHKISICHRFLSTHPMECPPWGAGTLEECGLRCRMDLAKLQLLEEGSNRDGRTSRPFRCLTQRLSSKKREQKGERWKEQHFLSE